MRVVGTIPHPQIRITGFHMNDKFIVKFEAGPMEQTLKFAQEDVGGVEAIQERLTDEILQRIVARFHEMMADAKVIAGR